MKKLLAIVLVGLAVTARAQWDISVRVTVPSNSIATVKAAVDGFPGLYTNVVTVTTVGGITRTNTVRTLVVETDRAKFKRLLAEALQGAADRIVQRGLARSAVVVD